MRVDPVRQQNILQHRINICFQAKNEKKETFPKYYGTDVIAYKMEDLTF